MKILIYNSERFHINDITEHSVIIINNKEFKSFLKCSNLINVKKIYIYVIKNFEYGYEELFAYYLKYIKYKKHSFSPTLNILCNWDKFLFQYNSKKYKNALEYINNLENIPIYFNTTKIKKNIKRFITHVKLNSMENGLLLNKRFSQRLVHDNWINRDFSYFSKITQLNFDTEFNAINMYISNILSLNTIFNDNITNKLYILSLYYYKLAIIYMDNEQYVYSYTLLHRALDSFLQFKCRITNNSLVLNNNGKISYNRTIQHLRGKQVYILNSIDCLRHNGLSFNSLDIENFNKYRNKTYLAHGQYSVAKMDLQKYFKIVKDFISFIDGQRWNNNLSGITFNHKMKPLDLFLYEPSFSTYIFNKTHEVTKTPA